MNMNKDFNKFIKTGDITYLPTLMHIQYIFDYGYIHKNMWWGISVGNEKDPSKYWTTWKRFKSSPYTHKLIFMILGFAIGYLIK